MTSTPTARLRLDKQALGDNPNAWGTNVNAVFDLVDEAVSGFAEISVNGNVVLTVNNFTSDQARRAILRFTGAGGFSVTIPAVEKMYYIDNRCAADVTLKTAATPGSVVVAGSKRIAYCDGATVTTDTSATAPSASGVSFNPSGNIASTNVQNALVELDSEKQAALGFTPVQQGTGIGQSQANVVKIGWDGSILKATVDGADLGELWAAYRAAFTVAGNGYVKLPNGFILQWCSITLTNAVPDNRVNWPMTFPNALLGFTASADTGDTTLNTLYGVRTDGANASGVNVRGRLVTSGSVQSAGMVAKLISVGA